MLKTKSLGFVFEAQVVNEPIDLQTGAEFKETVDKVLSMWIGKVEFNGTSGATTTFRVPGRDLFKAEQMFQSFMNQLSNQWKQGEHKRAKARGVPWNSNDHPNKITDPSLMVGVKWDDEPEELCEREARQRGESIELGQHGDVKPATEPAPEPRGFFHKPLVAAKLAFGEATKMGRLSPKYTDVPALGATWKHGAAIQTPEGMQLISVPTPASVVEAKPDLPPLAPEQQAAYDKIMGESGHFFLTGRAGTGKSFLSKHLIASGRVTACATTARAALLVGGCTVDKVFCFRRTDWEIWSHSSLQQAMDSSKPYILIDEASMVGTKMMAIIMRIAKQYRKKIIFVGDLAQASPVKDDFLVDSPYFQEIVAAGHVIILKESHRQTEEPLLKALDMLRHGTVDQSVRDMFMPRVVEDIGINDDRYGIRLYATNLATDAYNQQRLAALPTVGVPVTPLCRFTDMRVGPARYDRPFTEDQQEKHINDGSFAHMESFKINARVLATKNDPAGRFVNGDIGTIKDIRLADGTSAADAKPHNAFMGTAPPAAVESFVIEFDRLGYDMEVGTDQQSMKDAAGRDLYSLCGFPVRLGYAMSIHKAQGITVDKLFFDMASIMKMQGDSKHGLAYVALSRTRTIDGLHIVNWCDDAVYCAPAIRPYV